MTASPAKKTPEEARGTCTQLEKAVKKPWARDMMYSAGEDVDEPCQEPCVVLRKDSTRIKKKEHF